MIIKDPTENFLPPGIARRLRNAVWNRLKKRKKKICWRHLPYTPTQLGKHLEKQFQEGMTWENYGSNKGCWNMDHIYPISYWAHPANPGHPDFKKCWSLKNIRPMWVEENWAKGSSVPDNFLLDNHEIL